MDVRLTANQFYPSFQADTESAAVRQASDTGNVSVEVSNRENIVREIHEKVLMDLKDVQRFLYMLIGSEIKVESEKQNIGMNVNRVA